jgi:hypothetical protein
MYNKRILQFLKQCFPIPSRINGLVHPTSCKPIKSYLHFGPDFFRLCHMLWNLIKTGNLRITFRRVRLANVAAKKQYYIFWVCVCRRSYPACNAHAPYYIVICVLTGSAILFHIISQRARFSAEGWNIKCTFWFPLQLLSETFLILRRIYTYIINAHSSSRKVTVIIAIFWRNGISKQ